MNDAQKEGIKDQIKGKTNQVVGAVTGDHAKQAKGNIQEVAGKTEKAAGDVASDVNKADKTDRV